MYESTALTPKQRQRANALIKRLCANYDGGNCLALDDGEPCVCVQSISYSLLCKYFRNAVLPAEPMLEAAILGTRLDRCVSCGAPILKKGNRKKYCGRCAVGAYKKQQAEYARRKWAESKIGAEKVSRSKAFQLPHFEGQGVDTFAPLIQCRGVMVRPGKEGKCLKSKQEMW